MRLFRRPSGAVAAILIAATALMGTPAHAAESHGAVPQRISALPGDSVHTAAAARDGYCTAGDTAAVTVVVDFGSLGGGTIVRCASGLSRGATGLQALAAAGISTTGTVSDGGGFVCRLDGRPAADEIVPLPTDPGYTEQCVETPPAAATWSYWSAQDGGSWGYNTAGAGNRRVQLGGFEGWSFAAGDGTPPGVSPRLPAAPAPEPAPAPQPAPAPAPAVPAPAPAATTQAAAPAAPAPGTTSGSGNSGGSGNSSGSANSGGNADDGSAAGAPTSTAAAGGAAGTTDPAAGEPPAPASDPAASGPAASTEATPVTTASAPTTAVSTSAPTTASSTTAPPTSASTTTAPTTTDVDAAAAASGGSGAGWWTIGGVVLLAALAGGGLVLARRRRVED
ncbi:hypothetical protein JL107_13490 [Nakamurella flavida]|uniref:LPXTG cell wall anchor domain-containing protein n=1 Tax=Nakamurella flavida TaxID=363630 RepID=A0A938YK47_9ACTN|nr:hypothetical protein [Nakamurella flavida]MBM9477457.1 hypothetical protein [Nakamurella flavida]MDP9777390.1 hypothetical protein [Nakamurella flavida]